MDMLLKYLQKNNIPTRNIINLDSNTNYKGKVHESNHLTEPMMFIDNTGYLEFLKQKHSGINKEFWIDFEEDLSRLERERLGAEGPDEIVQRANYYISVLERYSKYFHTKHPNSRLIIWNGTHYDLISPLVKQDILNLEKSDVVNVENCGGVSLIVDKDGLITANINGVIYPFDFQETKQLHPHF